MSTLLAISFLISLGHVQSFFQTHGSHGSRSLVHPTQKALSQSDNGSGSGSDRSSSLSCNMKFNKSSSNGIMVKSNESFKLSDLYAMEARLQSQVRGWNSPEVLGFDRKTGSYLFGLDSRFAMMETLSLKNKNSIPSCMKRYDWISEPLAFGKTAIELVQDINNEHNARISNLNLDEFVLDYICIEHMEGKEYNSKTLLSRVSQCIPSTAVLNPKLARHKLIILETSRGLYLVKQLLYSYDGSGDNNKGMNENENENENDLYQKQLEKEKRISSNTIKQWSGRPYQYSSAINPTVALVVVELLYDLMTIQSESHERERERERERTTKHKKKKPNLPTTRSTGTLRMLDPTCGSATFLAFSATKGMESVGYDINEKCIEGARANLQFWNHIHTLTHQDVDIGDIGDIGERVLIPTTAAAGHNVPNVEVIHGDSSKPTLTCTEKENDNYYDCAITNLPWGQNTAIEDKDENKYIAEQVFRKLKYGAYCAFISKVEMNMVLNDVGFHIVEKCTIPPKDFLLPKSKKGDQKRDQNMGTSNCHICIVLKKEEEEEE